ncbi:glycosyltransferase family 2 protein [Candidatus Vampirococcus lugosii]|uniref:Glycosyl transferase n=1 Tax=Candidatus Vampirococcus lugosii TaxID=2789015 RepID=A0ABS5QQ82_9BACT|nr:glycosyltransferase family 2 protein [Candidatus Vampirococcus lugosii]MBS8122404.1 glycosyl transferase [Candidatus Vampirococcus lugosii]
MKNNKLISIILCSYNAEKFINTTVNSITNQTYNNFELLIIDNNSKDNTLKKIKELQQKDNRIKLFESKENLGAYGGINFLLNKANGDYIGIVDHDDIYHPNKFEIQIEFLETNKKYIGCGGLPIKYYEKTGKMILIKKNKTNYTTSHPSLVFRNIKGKKYDTSIKYRTDMYFMRYILCENQKKIYTIQKPLYLSRVRTDGKNYSSLWGSYDNIKTYYKKNKSNFFLIKELLKNRFDLYNKYIKLFGKKITENDLKKNEYLNEFYKLIK